MRMSPSGAAASSRCERRQGARPVTSFLVSSRFRCDGSRRPANDTQFPAARPAAEEGVGAVRLEPRYSNAGRHRELVQNLAALRIDPVQFARLGFQSAVPQFAFNPGDARHEAAQLKGMKDLPSLWIDLMNHAIAILSDPQTSFRPCHSGSTAFGRRN